MPATLASPRLHHSVGALAHSLSSSAWRGAFQFRRADVWFAPAVRVGIAGTLVLVGGGLLGHGPLAAIASLGALTSAFGRHQPYTRLARHLLVVAAAMVVSGATGALLGATGTTMWLQIAVVSLLAALAAILLGALRITGPGPVILVFAAGAGSGYAHTSAGIPAVVAALAIGSAVGWLVAMAPALVLPLGPARLGVARAVAALARLMENDDDAHRSATTVAVRSARETVALSQSTRRFPLVPSRWRLDDQVARLSTLLDTVEDLQRTAGTGTPGAASESAIARLRRHQAELRRMRRTLELPGVMGARELPGVRPARLREPARTALAGNHGVGRGLRMAAASALSGWAAVGLGLGHPLWAAMGAVAALQGINYRMTVQRGIQRLVGNVLGALVAAGLLSLSLGFWPAVAAVVVFQVLAEVLVLSNYTLTTIVVTPMALLMTGIGAPLAPDAAMSRVADTLVGVVVGVLVAAASISLADRHHLGLGD
ncbi:FUSC family protein [Specibacter cremeus]|uniref:FUSC family protein n=1 Tax=Specibacter cremeus TaxID=1629051 RepID=UPI000F770ADE|nr:FUSC family protein [Specibacter cremeus]